MSPLDKWRTWSRLNEWIEINEFEKVNEVDFKKKYLKKKS